MHRPQFFTWITHTAETTTLLEATRLQKLYTYMCNIVTEFYLYSIVYIYLINSRLDVTISVHHHFRTIQTLSITSQRSFVECQDIEFLLIGRQYAPLLSIITQR